MLVVYQLGRVGSKNVGSLRTSENDALLRILREERKRAGVSQEELSRRLGQSITFMVKVERGTRRLDVVEFIGVAFALGLVPGELLDRVVEQIKNEPN